MRRRLGPLPLLAGVLGVTGCASPDATWLHSTSQRVVYDEDDRGELFQLNDDVRRARAERGVVALVPDEVRELARDPSDPNALWSLPSLSEVSGVCSDQRFAEQPSAVVCTGTLIEPDLILTAGHCARGLDCEELSVIFGFFYDAEASPHRMTEADWYRCKEVVAFETPSLLAQHDFGWIRLDRDVAPPRAPLGLRLERTALADGAPLSMFDFGQGLPMKQQADARVRDARAETLDFFISDLDAFGGSSGAPVLNEQGEVVGVLAGGSDDYVTTDAGCAEVLTEPEAFAEERATYAFKAWEGLESGGMTPSAGEGSCRVPGRVGGSGWSILACLVGLLGRRSWERARSTSRRKWTEPHP